MAQLVKKPSAMQETWVRSLGWEDPLEKGKATHSVFWPGEFHGQGRLVGYILANARDARDVGSIPGSG